MINRIDSIYRGDFKQREQRPPTEGWKKKESGSFKDILAKEMNNVAPAGGRKQQEGR